MRWRNSTYDVDVRRDADPSRLAGVDADELARAAEDGDLAGNAMYQDLAACDWDDVADTLSAERDFIERLQGAADLDEAAEAIEEERLEMAGADELWNLDVGVAAATIALSALGAIPVSSCNAGGFGGHHQAHYPYVAFYIGPESLNAVSSLAAQAGVGLLVDEGGIAQVYGDTDLALLRFAEAALKGSGR